MTLYKKPPSVPPDGGAQHGRQPKRLDPRRTGYMRVMSIAAIGSVTEAPAPSPADFATTGASGLLIQSYAIALLGGTALALRSAPIDDFPVPPAPPPVAPVERAAEYGRIDVYA
jgi:hypothetical protein